MVGCDGARLLVEFGRRKGGACQELSTASLVGNYRVRAPCEPGQWVSHPTNFGRYLAPPTTQRQDAVKKKAPAELSNLRPGEQFSYRALAKMQVAGFLSHTAPWVAYWALVL